MAFSLLPKEIDFFILFDKLSNVAIRAAEYFTEICKQGKFDEDTVSKMREIEHEGDDITHEIIRKLNTTFITPFDREDIHALANELDSVIDMINTIVNRMKVYKLNGTNPDLVEFTAVVEKSIRAVAHAVAGLRDTKHLQHALNSCVEVNRLENVGDTMRDNILAKLFDTAPDTIYLIKWKEIFEDAETVLDVCEDVANIIESIAVKQA